MSVSVLMLCCFCIISAVLCLIHFLSPASRRIGRNVCSSSLVCSLFFASSQNLVFFMFCVG